MNGADIEFLRRSAETLLGQGRFGESVRLWHELLRWSPADAQAWFNLAWLLQQLGQFHPALQAYSRAVTCGVTDPAEAHVNRGVILAEQLERPGEAREEFERALSLDPAHVPALVNLGNLHEQHGDRAAARQAYERALALEPDQPLALARLPDLKDLDGASDALIGRLRTALSRHDLSPLQRADLAFGLGKALDSVGQYDEAFEAYRGANMASAELARAAGAAYDRLAHERLIDHLIQTDTGGHPAHSRDEEDSRKVRRLFICGMFRSGSTLVEQILASHPEVTPGGEVDVLPALVRKHLRGLREPFVTPDDALIKTLRDEYRSAVDALFPAAQVLTDKRPDNFLHLGLIRRMFPDSCIVHTRRNPMDNCLSVYFLHLGASMPYATDLEDIAHWYRQYRRLATHWQRRFGGHVHEIDYDQLVVQPQQVIERLLAHCGLPWNAHCLDFHRTPTRVKTPSAWQVRQPLYTRSCGRWRRYARHLAPLREALGDLASDA